MPQEYLELKVKCDIPKITNGKELFSSVNELNVLKIPVRKSTKISPLIFKNHSPYSIPF
jgi:hypothetical protein